METSNLTNEQLIDMYYKVSEFIKNLETNKKEEEEN